MTLDHHPKKDNAHCTVGGVSAAQVMRYSALFLKPYSIKALILGALLRGECLTKLDGWQRFRRFTLGDHVCDLKRDGWPIDIFLTPVPHDRCGGLMAAINCYYLPPEVIAEAGELGRQFAADTAQIEAILFRA